MKKIDHNKEMILDAIGITHIDCVSYLEELALTKGKKFSQMMEKILGDIISADDDVHLKMIAYLAVIGFEYFNYDFRWHVEENFGIKWRDLENMQDEQRNKIVAAAMANYFTRNNERE